MGETEDRMNRIEDRFERVIARLDATNENLAHVTGVIETGLASHNAQLSEIFTRQRVSEKGPCSMGEGYEKRIVKLESKNGNGTPRNHWPITTLIASIAAGLVILVKGIVEAVGNLIGGR